LVGAVDGELVGASDGAFDGPKVVGDLEGAYDGEPVGL